MSPRPRRGIPSRVACDSATGAIRLSWRVRGLLDGHGVEFTQRVAAGVVDQQVDAAVLLLDGLGQGLGCAGLGQVGGDVGYVRAGARQVGRHGLEVGGGSAGQHHVAALAGDLGGDQRPDTAGGAGDQGRTAWAQDVGSTHSD